MSLLKKRPKVDAKPLDPITGYLQISVNSTPVIRRPVTACQKSDTSVELAQMASQLWKLFGVACSLTLEYCSDSGETRDILVNFTR